MNVHGGMIASLADSAMFLAAGSVVSSGVTIQLNVSYISAAKPGNWVEGEGKLVKSTKHLAFITGVISTRGEIVATFTGIIKKTGAKL